MVTEVFLSDRAARQLTVSQGKEHKIDRKQIPVSSSELLHMVGVLSLVLCTPNRSGFDRKSMWRTHKRIEGQMIQPHIYILTVQTGRLCY